LKGRLKGELRIATFATPELKEAAEESYDYSAKDLPSLIEWAEREYATVK
jgi:thymidylate synthase ThyX